jgi:hypothetical protein
MERQKKVYQLPSEAIKKLEEIMQKRMLLSETATIIHCIVETHAREIENYKEIIKKRKRNDSLTPEEKILRDAERETAKKNARDLVMVQNARKICEALSGTEISNSNGTFGCEYRLFEKVGQRVLVGKRIVPYDLLTEEHVALQYRGGAKGEIDELVLKGQVS